MRTFLVLILLQLGARSVPAQTSRDFVGTWRLVSMDTPDSAGRWQPVWDRRPLGLIIYTADGHMSAQLYDSRRPKLGLRWENATPEAARRSFVGLVTYFGTYRVDEAARTVTHTVEGAMSPDWIGSKLVRAYRLLDADHIELRVLTSGEGQRVANGTVLVWERVH